MGSWETDRNPDRCKGIESSQQLGRHRWVIERTMFWPSGYRRLNPLQTPPSPHCLKHSLKETTLLCGFLRYISMQGSPRFHKGPLLTLADRKHCYNTHPSLSVNTINSFGGSSSLQRRHKI